MTLEELEIHAKSIPSMGGARLGPFLDNKVKNIRPNTTIVEVGSWLGAGTAQIALSLLKNDMQDSITIHAYDRWQASESETRKAKSNPELKLNSGDDTLLWVRSMLQPFGVSIEFHKGDLSKASWCGDPISIYIDDAAKTPEYFFHVLKTFGPAWIPGETILLLMDYHMWSKSLSGRISGHKCQQDFIESFPGHFERMSEFKKSYQSSYSNDAFLYKKAFDFDSLKPFEYPLLYPLTYPVRLQKVLAKRIDKLFRAR
jgi:hypothetical protein